MHVITSLLDKNLPRNEEIDGYYLHRCPSLGVLLSINPLTFIMRKLVELKADLIHAHSYIFFTTNQTALYKKFHNVPLLLHLHGGFDFSYPKWGSFTTIKLKIKEKIYDPTLGIWTIKKADAIGSVSKKDLEIVEKKWNIDKKKLFWIPNAVDTDKFNVQKRDTNNVVYIGRLEPWKGIHTILEVIKLVRQEHKNVNFTIVGTGSLLNTVKKHANKNVRILNKVPHSLIPQILSEATVLLLPSYMEGVPTACLEALAAGVPIVASDVGGLPEIIKDGENGYLVTPGNSTQYADKVLEILLNDKLRRRMGDNGKKLISESYTWKKSVKAVENIYKNIIT